MKTKNLIPIIIGIVTGTFVSSCERSKNPKVEEGIQHTSTGYRTTDPTPVTTDRTVVKNNPNVQNDEDVSKYREEVKAKIDANDRAIADFREKMKNEKASVKAKYDRKTDELEQKNHHLKDRMNSYKGESHEKWQEFKREFNHDMDELGKSIKDLGKDNVK